jgi:2-keto-4-pentenoate hydratase/2-oxohepta-3-ene-1,7-dioic acid hydratase in catechol pathway
MKTVILEHQSIVPSKIICIGRNYVEHIAELGNEIPDEMVVFNKPNSAISTELNSYHLEQLHYEGELCFLVKDGGFSAVAFGLDLTKRNLQSKLKAKGLPWERAKAFNGAAVFSEFVKVNMTEINDQLRLELSIDEKIVQSGSVQLMIYKPTEILAELKSYTELNDGDIVMTGTPKGVGAITKGARFKGRVFISNQELVSMDWVAN